MRMHYPMWQLLYYYLSVWYASDLSSKYIGGFSIAQIMYASVYRICASAVLYYFDFIICA